MKNLLKSKYIPFLALALGVVGFGLRKMLYALALDQKNLLTLGHPLEILLWLTAALTAVLVILALRRESPESAQVFPAGAEAFGSVAMAAGVALTVLGYGTPNNTLAMVRALLGLVSAGMLVLTAWSKWKGQPSHFLPYAALCVFLAVHMVGCYRGWSSNPQLQDYVFTLFASLGLMLFAYQHAACAADCGNRRYLAGAGLTALYACAVCLSGTIDGILYLTGGIWVLTNGTPTLSAEPVIEE